MKQRIENWILRHLLNAPSLSEIIGTDQKTGIVHIDGKAITPNELKQLQAEVKAMEGFRVWKLMSETTKHLAEDKVFNKSVNMDDIRYGKAMLYNIDLQKSIMKVIRNKIL
jgi:hypothetical protein